VTSTGGATAVEIQVAPEPQTSDNGHERSPPLALPLGSRGDGMLAMMVLFALLLQSGSVGTSASAAEVAVRAVFESPLRGNEEGEAMAHLFCDREARLAINVSASSPRRIDLRARLVQLGSGLAAPLGEAIPVILNEEVGPTARGFALRLTLPTVKRASELELRFFCRSPGEHAWLPAGRTPLRIYPADVVEPLRSLGKDRSLLVLDAGGRLKDFLLKADVAFLDLPAFLPGAAPLRPGRGNLAKPGPENSLAIWVKGATHSETQDSRRTLERLFRAAGTVIVLGGISDDYPKMRLIRARNKTRVDVEIPLLPSLAADPRSQLAIVEAVLLSVSSEETLLFDPGGSP